MTTDPFATLAVQLLARIDAIVVVGCGARKAAQPTTADKLYLGSYHRAALRAALALVPRERVLILSARYGLLGLDDLVEPYELRLGQPGAIQAAELRDQAARRGLAGRPLVALCGAAYATLLQEVWAEVATPLAGVGGLGRQLQVLAALRRAGWAARLHPQTYEVLVQVAARPQGTTAREVGRLVAAPSVVARLNALARLGLVALDTLTSTWTATAVGRDAAAARPEGS
jgi:hypothetical protein